MNQDQYDRLCELLPKTGDAWDVLETMHEEEDLSPQEKEAIRFALFHAQKANECIKGAIFAD
jgi:hypothetical protein